jgi:putative DNA primase/helicase
MDYTLVFCGAEGQGKSTGIEIIGGEWFTDSVKDISNSEALIQIQGIWIVEFAELEGWRKARDFKGLRAFLTERDDKYRNKYGRFWESHPRRCVFAGTTNEDWFLEGGSEGRRFWPVRCIAPVKLDELRRDREQLIAEAMVYWLDGEKPFLTDPLLVQAASLEREYYKQQDAWLDDIANHCAQRPIGTIFTTADILKNALGQEKARMNHADQKRVATCLRTLGYEPHQFGSNSKRLRGWRLAEK